VSRYQHAIDAWQSTEWSPYFHKVGYVRLAQGKERLEAIDQDFEYFSNDSGQKRGPMVESNLKKSDRALHRMTKDQVDKGDFRTEGLRFPPGCFRRLKSRADIKDILPSLPDEGFQENWQGYLNTHAGYALASESIKATHQKCVELGVKFELGERGHIVELINSTGDPHGDDRDVVAIKAADGTVHQHPPEMGQHLTILSLGAHLPRLLPVASSQVMAKAWSVAHLELSAAEARVLKDAPVMNFSELGFWMAPLWVSGDELRGEDARVVRDNDNDEDQNGRYLLKLAAHGGGWTNFTESSSPPFSASVPPRHPISTIPASDEALLRHLVRTSLPKPLHDRPFIRTSICWCADTPDSEYIIDFVPSVRNVVLAGADSGHAFKMFPIAGGWLKQLVEAGMQQKKRWRWKANGASDHGGAVGSDGPGQSVAWRAGWVRDLKDSGLKREGDN